MSDIKYSDCKTGLKNCIIKISINKAENFVLYHHGR